MNLLGRVAANSDSVVMSTFDIAQDMYAGSGLGDPLGLTGAWNAAEFNVFGDGNSTEANFSSGTTFSVAIDVGGEATCTTPIHGVTAESNNLTAVTSLAGTTCCAWKATPTYGGIQFTQSNADGAQSICQAADSCIQPGAACSAGGVGCCAIGGQHVRRVRPDGVVATATGSAAIVNDGVSSANASSGLRGDDSSATVLHERTVLHEKMSVSAITPSTDARSRSADRRRQGSRRRSECESVSRSGARL
jgi:hypothetical protein